MRLLISVVACVSILSIGNSSLAQGFPADFTNADADAYNHCVDLIEANKSVEAEPILKDIVQKHPTFTSGFFNLGRALIDQGKYDEALPIFESDEKLNPSDNRLLIQIGQCHQELAHYDDALRYYKLFLDRVPSSPNAEIIRTRVKTLTEDRARLSRNAGADNYFSADSFDGRWPASLMPLKVYIPGSDLPNYRPQFQEAVRKAFREWQDNSNGKVSVTFVDKLDNAQIECIWISDPRKIDPPGEPGVCDTVIIGDVYDHAKVSILLGKSDMSAAQVQIIALHEGGHSLGLKHSDKGTDIMFALFNDSVTKNTLSDRDKKTLQKLYDTPLKSDAANSSMAPR